MEEAEFNATLLAAYEGERAAVVTLDRLRGLGLTPTEQRLIDLFIALETAVGDRIEPLVRRRGLPVELSASRIDQAQARADDLCGWPAVVASLGDLDTLIARFRAVRDAAPAADRGALDCLVDHEVALARFGVLLRAGRIGEAEAGLSEAIRRART